MPEHGGQASQQYVAARLGLVVDTGVGFDGVDVRVVAVDFKAMLIQQFDVGDDGRRLKPIGKPSDCTRAAREGLDVIGAPRVPLGRSNTASGQTDTDGPVEAPMRGPIAITQS
jgi:hypothetical protein